MGLSRGGLSFGHVKLYKRPAALCWAFFCRRGRRCLFFGGSLPFFLDASGGRASCVAPANEALVSAAVSVDFADLALVLFSGLGVSAILFSGAVELQPPHFFSITSVGLVPTSTASRFLSFTRFCTPTRESLFRFEC